MPSPTILAETFTVGDGFPHVPKNTIGKQTYNLYQSIYPTTIFAKQIHHSSFATDKHHTVIDGTIL